MPDRKHAPPVMSKKSQGRVNGRFAEGNKISNGASNFKGPPRSQYLTQHLISELNEKLRNGQTTKARALVKKLIDMGLDGDLKAIEMIFDRVEGKLGGSGLFGKNPFAGDGEGENPNEPVELTLRIGRRDSEGNESVAEATYTRAKREGVAGADDLEDGEEIYIQKAVDLPEAE